MNDSTNTSTSSSRAPTHIAYHVRETNGGKSYWNRVGSAWSHADGKGFSIQIETVPLDGRISLRVPSENQQ